MQSCCLTQHARSTVHRVAQNLFLAPERPVSELLPYDLTDQDLFRGNVPQPRDWLRAWNACRTASSFLQAEKQYETEDYASGRRCSVKRRSHSDCFVNLSTLASLMIVIMSKVRYLP